MTQVDQQVASLRRELELLRKTQVIVSDSKPLQPSITKIWRDGGVTKWWDGKNWKADETSGGVLEFSTDVVFSSSSRTQINWTSGVLKIGTSTGVGTYAISSGGFNMTANTFFYWSPDMPNAIQTTVDPELAVISGGIIIAVGIPNSDMAAATAGIKVFGAASGDIITADQLAANSVTANKLAAQLVYAGSLVLAANGVIRGGQTTYNTGNGFFLGYHSGAYKLSIGDSSANYFTYDGASMVINGGMIRTAPSGARIEISGNNIRSYSVAGTYPGFQTNSTGFRLGYESGGTTYVSDTMIEGVAGSLPIVRMQGRLKVDDFQSLGNANISGGATIGLSATVGSDLTISGTTYCNGKLKIPVGTNLY